jgi:hypothetical protein
MWILIAVLIMLAPLGLLASGTAFAEWSSADLEAIFGMTPPAGLTSLENLYHAPFKGYSIFGATSFAQISLAYVLAAIIGVSILGLCLFVFYRIKTRGIISEA